MSGHEDQTELADRGFCVLRGQFPVAAIEACREAFWPVLLAHLEREQPNRGPHRHFLPMPFTPPCFQPAFFFDPAVLAIVRGAMDERVVADQWGCDVPVLGSEFQAVHVDFQRPLFTESPDLALPAYMLVVSFGLLPITAEDGPIEIAPRTHRLPRQEALDAVNSGRIALEPVPLDLGDVLIRHPWALHRGTPNRTTKPRALASIRYVRHWYTDGCREVETIPQLVWDKLLLDQQSMLRLLTRGAP